MSSGVLPRRRAGTFADVWDLSGTPLPHAFRFTSTSAATLDGMNVSLNEAALRHLLESEEGPVGQHLRRVAEEVAERARQQVPVDSGRLRDSITVEVGRDAQGLRAEVRADTPYAGVVERRTGFLTNAAQQVLGTNAVREFVRGATEQAGREVRQSQRRN
jgi:hypothetical protein